MSEDPGSDAGVMATPAPQPEASEADVIESQGCFLFQRPKCQKAEEGQLQRKVFSLKGVRPRSDWRGY